MILLHLKNSIQAGLCWSLFQKKKQHIFTMVYVYGVQFQRECNAPLVLKDFTSVNAIALTARIDYLRELLALSQVPCYSLFVHVWNIFCVKTFVHLPCPYVENYTTNSEGNFHLHILINRVTMMLLFSLLLCAITCNKQIMGLVMLIYENTTFAILLCHLQSETHAHEWGVHDNEHWSAWQWTLEYLY